MCASMTSEHRIISMIASATEIICALGYESDMIGRSHECDFPASIKDLPVCTAPKFNVEGTSCEIDQRVKAIVQDSLSVYRVDARILDELQPTHIVTQSQCEVCAVSLKDVEQAVCELTSSHPRIVSLEPNQLSDVWKDIKRVADALGDSESGDRLTARLQDRIKAIAEKGASVDSRPTVACVEWIDPLMAGGNWMPELIEMAGGVNLFGEAGKHSPWMTFEEMVEKDPDVIFVSPCGFDIARTTEEMHLLSDKKEWQSLAAVRNGRVHVADGNAFFNRPGPRLVESLEILAEVLHPERFKFGHHGSGWIRYES